MFSVSVPVYPNELSLTDLTVIYKQVILSSSKKVANNFLVHGPVQFNINSTQSPCRISTIVKMSNLVKIHCMTPFNFFGVDIYIIYIIYTYIFARSESSYTCEKKLHIYMSFLSKTLKYKRSYFSDSDFGIQSKCINILRIPTSELNALIIKNSCILYAHVHVCILMCLWTCNLSRKFILWVLE